ncbi:ORF13 [Psittacine aviadenovirus B]|uniref:ORF13 n=1 Tax=psittacine adenovirus 4 TaxID=2773287 RepID=A0A1P8SW77_9ADEN|nr:ORF13 [Psittacine aviadenovirus B]APY28360.1 ORF13 [psittacine adenovirus 4]
MSEISEEEYRSPSPPLPPKKRRQPSSGRNAPRPSAQKPRGKYRSWAKYRVIICEALRDAVFDKTKAAQILKRAYGVYVPPAILSYYEKKLTDSFSPLVLLSSEQPQADRE